MARLIRITQASAYLGLSPTTVRRWVRSGLIPVFKGPSNRWWWTKQLLDEIKNDMLERGNDVHTESQSTPHTVCK
jgi:predicted site-specific integrase-resolvase